MARKETIRKNKLFELKSLDRAQRARMHNRRLMSPRCEGFGIMVVCYLLKRAQSTAWHAADAGRLLVMQQLLWSRPLHMPTCLGLPAKALALVDRFVPNQVSSDGLARIKIPRLLTHGGVE